MSKCLDLNSLKKRMVRNISCKDALKDVSPLFSDRELSSKIKISVDKDKIQCVKEET